MSAGYHTTHPLSEQAWSNQDKREDTNCPATSNGARLPSESSNANSYDVQSEHDVGSS